LTIYLLRAAHHTCFIGNFVALCIIIALFDISNLKPILSPHYLLWLIV